MEKKEILEFIKENRIAYLATVDGTAARVRGMDTFRADDNGLIFYTGKKKDVFKQIAQNPEVEVCYFSKDLQVRVRGTMEILEDLALKKEVVSKRSFLKPFYQDEQSYNDFAVMRLKGKVTTWSMQNVAAPKTFIDL